MSDPQQNLEQWKQELSAQGLDAESIEELESHLLETMADLCEQGMSEQEAFDAACQQMGSTQSIGGEFRKEESLLVSDWIVLGLCTLVVLGLLIGIACFTLTAQHRERVISNPLLSVHVITLTLSYVAMFGFAGLGMYSVLRRLFTQRSEYSWMETCELVLRWDGLSCLLLVTIGLVTGCLWSHDSWGTYWSWSPKEMGGLLIWAWYVVAVTCAWFRIIRPGLIPALSITGGLFCLFGWMGTMGLPLTFLFVVLCSVLLGFLFTALALFRPSPQVEMAN